MLLVGRHQLMIYYPYYLCTSLQGMQMRTVKAMLIQSCKMPTYLSHNLKNIIQLNLNGLCMWERHLSCISFIYEQEADRYTKALPPLSFMWIYLAFVTGADCIPSLGFDINPAILFSTDRSRLLPVASTCYLTLTLSVGLVEYDAFQRNMDMGVLNMYEIG